MKLFKDFGVRALLATIVVSSAVVAGLYLVISVTDIALGIGFLSNAASMALGFYFGQRNVGGTV